MQTATLLFFVPFNDFGRRLTVRLKQWLAGPPGMVPHFWSPDGVINPTCQTPLLTQLGAPTAADTPKFHFL